MCAHENVKSSLFGRKSQKTPCFRKGVQFRELLPFGDFSRVARTPLKKQGENRCFWPPIGTPVPTVAW
jgi:hypothetical protein